MSQAARQRQDDRQRDQHMGNIIRWGMAPLQLLLRAAHVPLHGAAQFVQRPRCEPIKAQRVR